MYCEYMAGVQVPSHIAIRRQFIQIQRVISSILRRLIQRKITTTTTTDTLLVVNLCCCYGEPIGT